MNTPNQPRVAYICAVVEDFGLELSDLGLIVTTPSDFFAKHKDKNHFFAGSFDYDSRDSLETHIKDVLKPFKSSDSEDVVDSGWPLLKAYYRIVETKSAQVSPLFVDTGSGQKIAIGGLPDLAKDFQTY